jgi:hypothetical protein
MDQPSMLPGLRSLVRQLVIAGVFPIVGYALLRPHVPGDAVALAIVLVFPAADVLGERVWRRRFEPIGIIVLAGICIGLIGAVALHGDPLLLKMRESLLTGVFGLVCLLSLAAPRPVMFYLGRAFATGGDAGQAAEFDKRWLLPTVPRRFRISTTVWGISLTGEAAVRTALALNVSTQLFLVLSQVISWTVLGGLLWFSVLYSRAGERYVTAWIQAHTSPGTSTTANPPSMNWPLPTLSAATASGPDRAGRASVLRLKFGLYILPVSPGSLRRSWSR